MFSKWSISSLIWKTLTLKHNVLVDTSFAELLNEAEWDQIPLVRKSSERFYASSSVWECKKANQCCHTWSRCCLVQDWCRMVMTGRWLEHYHGNYHQVGQRILWPGLYWNWECETSDSHQCYSIQEIWQERWYCYYYFCIRTLLECEQYAENFKAARIRAIIKRQFDDLTKISINQHIHMIIPVLLHHIKTKERYGNWERKSMWSNYSNIFEKPQTGEAENKLKGSILRLS